MGSSRNLKILQISVRNALSKRVTNATVILVSLCFLDMAHTLFAVRMGIAQEANPLLAPFIQTSDLSFLFVKGASFVIPLTIVELLRTKKPQFARTILNFGAFAYPICYIVGTALVHI